MLLAGFWHTAAAMNAYASRYESSNRFTHNTDIKMCTLRCAHHVVELIGICMHVLTAGITVHGGPGRVTSSEFSSYETDVIFL